MSTLENLRGGISQFWDSVAEGWRHLISRASGALTRFRSQHADAGNMPVKGSEWGLLAVDLSDDDNKVIVHLEAPGMELDDFDVCVHDDMLIVRGEKHFHSERHEAGYQIAECAYGSFERAIPLPENVDGSLAKAKYRRGVLRIELPKTSGGRQRVEITAD